MPEIVAVGPGGPQPPCDIEVRKARLRDATRKMESYFVGMLLKRLNESATAGGLFEQRTETATYRDMMHDAIASEIGKRGAFGIADMLYRQMVTQIEAEER
ncbi:MAG TPA: rod-binding protein [Chthonomonadales bacterium]|nr:rod-binding protein [Chthonomonadales bacterium]